MTALEVEPAAGGGLGGGGVGRGVLEGAFILLDVLAGSDDGSGLSALARQSGLPKATTYRLVEQLVGLGVVERHGHRYVVGRLLGRLGASWRPHPRLRQAAQQPIRVLAARSETTVAVSVLYDGRLKPVVSVSGAVGGQLHAFPTSEDLLPRTAAGRVLLATEVRKRSHEPSSARGRCYGDPRNASEHVVVDEQGVLPGVCCVATAVRLPDGYPAAAVSALALGTKVPPGLGDLVRRASRAITRNMMSDVPGSLSGPGPSAAQHD